jgi:hypothetical protein
MIRPFLRIFSPLYIALLLPFSMAEEMRPGVQWDFSIELFEAVSTTEVFPGMRDVDYQCGWNAV